MKKFLLHVLFFITCFHGITVFSLAIVLSLAIDVFCIGAAIFYIYVIINYVFTGRILYFFKQKGIID